MTAAEAKLWDMLRDRRFDGLKFRRQAPVAGAIADFLCAELALVLELDGGIHRDREAADAARDARLVEAGYMVIRETNAAFERNPNELLGRIREHALQKRPTPPHPTGSAGHLLPRGEKGH